MVGILRGSSVKTPVFGAVAPMTCELPFVVTVEIGPGTALPWTVELLESVMSPRSVAARRGKKVAEIFGRRGGEEEAEAGS